MGKKLNNLMMMYGAMAMMGNMTYQDEPQYRGLTDKEKEQLKAIVEQKRKERLKKQGVTEYFYGNNSVFARNKKNADRKARNKGYL